MVKLNEYIELEESIISLIRKKGGDRKKGSKKIEFDTLISEMKEKFKKELTNKWLNQRLKEQGLNSRQATQMTSNFIFKNKIKTRDAINSNGNLVKVFVADF